MPLLLETGLKMEPPFQPNQKISAAAGAVPLDRHAFLPRAPLPGDGSMGQAP